jgi:hypothetical protein
MSDKDADVRRRVRFLKRVLGLFILVSGLPLRIWAQSADVPVWEAGPLLSLTGFGTGALSTGRVRVAYGGRITANVHRNAGIEYQMAFFPELESRTDVQGSGHLKLTFRAEQHYKLNFFAIAGPGFLHDRARGPRFQPIISTSVAFVYGGGLEVVPQRHYSIRLDLTDFYAGRHVTFGRFWQHRLDFKTAIMIRF